MSVSVLSAGHRRRAGAAGIVLTALVALAAPSSGCSGGATEVSRSRPGSGGTSSRGGSSANAKAGASGGTDDVGQGGVAGTDTGVGAANGGGGDPFGDTTDNGIAGSGPLVLPACGDGTCDHDSNEVCETCPADCGACATCGNGICEKGDGAAAEACGTCIEDCGACSACGDGVCGEKSGETCETCAADCGTCMGCGDGACGVDENCDSCAVDCGACKPCGDGVCGADETCATCDDDCGVCQTCGDGNCLGAETPESCAKDCAPAAPVGCIQGDFKPYWGGLHAHTSASDGQGTSGQAFAHASRDAKPPLDFLYLSDHYNAISDAEWKRCVNAANKYNEPGKFVAGCGYERTVFEKNDGVGHFNFLFPNKLLKNLPSSLPGIYNTVDDCGPCLGQFNHPPMPGRFLDYKMFPSEPGRDKVRLIEFNGGGSWAQRTSAYFRALANGWEVSPSWNEDNHSRTWGDTQRATLVWASKLSRGAIREAVEENRTVATNDDTASLKMLANGCWMGSKLRGFGDTTITVTLSDKQKEDGFGVVNFIGPKQNKLGSRDCAGKNPCTVTLPIKITEKTHVVAIAHQTDGNVLISAPLWWVK